MTISAVESKLCPARTESPEGASRLSYVHLTHKDRESLGVEGADDYLRAQRAVNELVHLILYALRQKS